MTDVLRGTITQHVPRGTIELTLPFAPSGNKYWRVFEKRIIKSKEGKDYLNTVALLTGRYRRAFWEGRLEVQIDVYPPDEKPRDLDNCSKILLDALEYAQLMQNDSQIDRLVVERKCIVENGQCIVRIMEMNNNV